MPNARRRGPAAANVTKGKAAQLETLEDRFLLSGSPGPDRGRDDDRGRGRFRPITTSQLVATADFNKDGKADLVSVDRIGFGNKFTLSPVTVRLGKGDGTFTPTALKITLGSPAAVLTGDFNGDGNQDVALVSVVKGQTQVSILSGNGAGKFGSPVTQSVGVLPVDNITAGDIKGDGFTDLFSFNDTAIFTSINNAGKLLPAVQTDVRLSGATPAGAADVNGDGRPDLIGVLADQILFNSPTSADGDFNSVNPVTLTSSIPLAGKRLTTADVNGDGRPDLVAIGDGSVSVALATPDALTFAAWTTQATSGVDPARTLAGDVDGDGKADLFQANDSTGFFKAKLILIGNGDGTFHKLVFGNGRGHGFDFDGDDDD